MKQLTTIALTLSLVSLTGILPVQANDQYGSSESLRNTILEIENRAANQHQRISGADLNGIDAWVDETKINWRTSDLGDLGDLNEQRVSFEVKLKNGDQVNAEQDILNMGQAKADLKFASLLERKLKVKYASLINYIEQEKRAKILQQQQQVTRSELNNWKMKVNSDGFRADRLQQADIFLDSIGAEEAENNATLNRYRQSFGNNHSGYAPDGIISIQQMIQYTQHILDSEAFLQHSNAIQKAEFEIGLADKKRQRSDAKEQFSLNSVKVEYDNDDDNYGATVGIRLPITRNSYDSLLQKQEVYYSNIDAQNTVINTADQLQEKQYQLLRLQDESVRTQTLLHNINKRMGRLSNAGNVDLMIDLKTKNIQFLRRQDRLLISALRQYIDFLNVAGMLSAQPYRNWIQTGTPRIL